MSKVCMVMRPLIKASRRRALLLVDHGVESKPHRELAPALKMPPHRSVRLSQRHIRREENGGSPDLSTYIRNTILIPSGSKEAASFACLSLGAKQKTARTPPSPQPSAPYSPTPPSEPSGQFRFDQSIPVHEPRTKCSCLNNSLLQKNKSSVAGTRKPQRQNFYQKTRPWCWTENHTALCCFLLRPENPQSDELRRRAQVPSLDT